MADTFLTSPRRQSVQIKLHCGELVSIILQEAVLKEISEEELQKIAVAVNAELQSRGE